VDPNETGLTQIPYSRSRRTSHLNGFMLFEDSFMMPEKVKRGLLIEAPAHNLNEL
jgi:hypothetical protein